ncbi:Crystallin J1A [Takifugu flavidus]|uniref:Crystallin J1A n=1 Tax=Takifugu flavidus TaxID=433684 RepID=A0A5C6P0X8_9TELE|nr:Crystallin J1A [Takifugu flavidus]
MASALANRAVGAIVGSAVADAAAQPMHWIYDLQKLHVILAQDPNPEFRAESANPFYRRQTGQQSCYGDQAFVLLESLSECGGPRPQLPVEGPWRQASLKSFLKNIDAGKEETGCVDDCQMDGITKLAPVVAFYAGKPEMLEKVEDAVRVTQNNDACVAETLAAARFLEHFILNGPDPTALESVLEQLRDPNRKQPQDLDKAVIGLPGAFQAALYGVLTAHNYVEAVRDTMSCGGCTCSRGSFIGACLGAQVGLEGIPASWTSRTLRYESVLEHAKKITRHHQ